MRSTWPWILSMMSAVMLVATASAQQQSAPAPAPASPYTAPPIPDEEAVSVSVSAATPLTNPLVTALDPMGDESSCIVPCTFRSRVGVTHFEGTRLAVDVELAAAGVTYDVQLTPGPTGEDIAVVTTFLITGAALLSLGIWAFTDTGDEDVLTAAGFAVGYGGLAVLITLPWLITLLATLDGTASVLRYQRGLSAGLVLTEGGPAIAF